MMLIPRSSSSLRTISDGRIESSNADAACGVCEKSINARLSYRLLASFFSACVFPVWRAPSRTSGLRDGLVDQRARWSSRARWNSGARMNALVVASDVVSCSIRSLLSWAPILSCNHRNSKKVSTSTFFSGKKCRLQHFFPESRYGACRVGECEKGASL